jgi:hypothetical protein
LQSGRLNALAGSHFGRKFGFGRQFQYSRTGDVSRRLGLVQSISRQGGWRNRRNYGRLSRSFTSYHFGSWYVGPSFYPRYSWFPRWSSWVNWSWWDDPGYYYDPRPAICQPVIYSPSSGWTPWNTYPTWQSLPAVSSGTWVDVAPAQVNAGFDLQLLAVRFVDPGHPEKKLGPRYRVFFRNNSRVDIASPFNVVLIAANGQTLPTGQTLVTSGVKVTGIAAGETQSVDIRLPFEASIMRRDDEGHQIPFSHLHVLVDSHRQVQEADESNNGAVLPVGEILPVDPAAFAAESDTLAAGSTVSIAGEGFGPEPGYVVVYIKELELQAEIEGWYDLGVRVKLPELPIVESTEAQIVVVRGDGAASNPLTVTLTPPSTPPVPMLEE